MSPTKNFSDVATMLVVRKFLPYTRIDSAIIYHTQDIHSVVFTHLILRILQITTTHRNRIVNSLTLYLFQMYYLVC